LSVIEASPRRRDCASNAATGRHAWEHGLVTGPIGEETQPEATDIGM